MSVVVIGSVTASPGVTTSTLALAAVWHPERPVVIVEADPDGGVLAARCGLRREPGLVTLAADGRRGLSPKEVAAHTQRLPGGVPVVVASPDPDETGRALEAAGVGLASALVEARPDVLVDVGRIRPSSPTRAILTRADAVVVVARPRLDELLPLAARLRTWDAGVPSPTVVLVGERPYPPDEVADVLDTPVLGALADDPRTAQALGGVGGSTQLLRRSVLLRSARELVGSLVSLARQPDTEPPHQDTDVPDPVNTARASQTGGGR